MLSSILRPFLIFCLALLAHIVQGQEIPRSVIGSAGTYFEHPTAGSLHWTVGEVAVSNYDNGIQLAEGFHQGYYELIVSTREIEAGNWSVKVYPNPATELLQIQIPESASGRALLFDPLGRLVQEMALPGGQGQMEVSRLPAATYWLTVRSSLGRQQTFQVQIIRS